MIEPMSVGIKFAIGIVLLIFAYLGAVTFGTVADTGIEHAKTIIPYLLGIVTTLVGYYWGQSSAHNRRTGEKTDDTTPE